MQVLCSTRMSHFRRYPTLHLIVMLYGVYDMEWNAGGGGGGGAVTQQSG